MFTYYAKVLRIVDGDTFDAQVDLGFRMYTKMRFRLAGIDTPEIWRPSCEAEKEHGTKAAEFLKNLVGDGLIVVAPIKAGIYDRWLAHAFVIETNEDPTKGAKIGANIADLLKESGFEKKSDYTVPEPVVPEPVVVEAEPCCTVEDASCDACGKEPETENPEKVTPAEAEVDVTCSPGNPCGVDECNACVEEPVNPEKVTPTEPWPEPPEVEEEPIENQDPNLPELKPGESVDEPEPEVVNEEAEETSKEGE